ncbi:MAG: hypothetical protein LUD01_01035 [Clostridiales bacterium]|nr:hypothetical protein [Clostridiales bacterium]
MDLNRKIQKFIRKLHRWVCWRYLVNRLFRCLPFGLAAGACMELAAYFLPWYRVHIWAAGAVGFSLAAAVVWSLTTRPDQKKAALELDRTGFRERTVTALELLDDDGFFARMQKEDAWEHLSEVKMRRQLPVALSRKNCVILASLLAVLVICAAAPSPAKEEAKERYLIAQQAKEASEKIEETAEELEEKTEAGELSEEENEKYQEFLEQLQQELGEVKTAEELEKALERAEYKIAEMSENTENQSAQESMNQLAQALGGGENGSSDTLTADADTNNSDEKDASADQLTEEELEAAKEQLEETEQLAETAEELLERLDEEDPDDFSDEDLDDLAEALEALSEAADSGDLSQQFLTENSDLMQQLSEAASSAAGGQLSVSQIASALAAAGSVKAQAQTQLAQIDTDGASIAQNSDGMAADGSDENGSDGNGSSSGDNDGEGNGSGSGNGNGSSSGSGNGSGSGSGNGSGSGSGNGSGGGWNYGSKNGTEETASYNGETVTVPDTVGDDENLTGEAGEGTTYSTNGNSLTWFGNEVAYDQVIGSYTEQALSEIQGANYPGGLQDLIRSYFSELNGE